MTDEPAPDAPTAELPPVATAELPPVTTAASPAVEAGPGRSAGDRWRSVLRPLRGIRGRVVLAFVLLVAGALALTLLVVRQVLLVQVDRDIEASLVQEVEELERLAVEGVDPLTGAPFGEDVGRIFDHFLARNVPARDEVFLTVVDGEPYLQSVGTPRALASNERLLRRWADLTEPLRLDVGEGEREVRSLAVPLLDTTGGNAGTFVVAFLPASDRAEVARSVRVLGVAGLGVLVVAALVATGLASRVLRPVTELAGTTRRVGENDLTARFAVTGEDEIAELGTSFNQMLDRLEAGFAAQRDVLDDVAHELRTPITIVRGHLELLDEDPAQREQTVRLCLDELDRMGRYVDDLLVVASAGRPDFLRHGPVDVADLVDGVLQRARALGDRDWRRGPAPRPGEVIVDGDGERLTQALVNLVGNAFQHTSDGDRIDVSAAVEGRSVRISVRDHGVGIDPDVRDRLFTRFSRASPSRTRRPEGTGLGLAIVAAIADAHGGTVAAEDPPGGGARFVLTLPLLDDDADDPEERP